MDRRGRPRTRRLTRGEQLRRAKRVQRRRERDAGQVHVQLTLPRPLAAKLAAAARVAGFAAQLDRLLDEAVVHVADFGALREIAWSRTAQYLPAREAFALYERNWRFVDPRRLDERERALIERLARTFGAGVINA